MKTQTKFSKIKIGTKRSNMHQRLVNAREHAIASLRDAIKDCPTCSEASGILCTECETRYLENLKGKKEAA